MEPQKKPVKKINNDYFRAVGRRKEAVARLRLFKGNGLVTVNGKKIEEYFTEIGSSMKYNRPFTVTNTKSKYNATVKVSGGGHVSQLDAVIHGLSRVLVEADETLKKTLRKEGLLTRDPRVKERRKYGLAQKARAKKQSPKR